MQPHQTEVRSHGLHKPAGFNKLKENLKLSRKELKALMSETSRAAIKSNKLRENLKLSRKELKALMSETSRAAIKSNKLRENLKLSRKELKDLMSETSRAAIMGSGAIEIYTLQSIQLD